MKYDSFFWNVFENYGMPEAYVNYRHFSRLDGQGEDIQDTGNSPA